jgi:hypothetical protein
VVLLDRKRRHAPPYAPPAPTRPYRARPYWPERHPLLRAARFLLPPLLLLTGALILFALITSDPMRTLSFASSSDGSTTQRPVAAIEPERNRADTDSVRGRRDSTTRAAPTEAATRRASGTPSAFTRASKDAKTSLTKRVTRAKRPNRSSAPRRTPPTAGSTGKVTPPKPAPVTTPVTTTTTSTTDETNTRTGVPLTPPPKATPDTGLPGNSEWGQSHKKPSADRAKDKRDRTRDDEDVVEDEAADEDTTQSRTEEEDEEEGDD